MLSIPIQFDAARYDIWVVLEDENFERIKKYDPGELDLDKMPLEWRKLDLRRVVFAYANAEEITRLSGASSKADLRKQLRSLNRGWRYQPEKGDSDSPYQMPAKN